MGLTFQPSVFATTFMLIVTFSRAPECVEADCWNQAFPTPPVPPDPVVICVIVVVLYSPYEKNKVGNAFTGRRLSLHNDILGLWGGSVGGGDGLVGGWRGLPFNVLQKRYI